MNRLLLSCGLMLFVSSVFGQKKITEFSEDTNEFITQMETFMTSSKRKVMEELFEDFEKQFKGGAYTEEEFKLIHQTSNAMLGQKMKSSPYFSEYLKTLTIIKKGEKGPERFVEWHTVLNQMLGDIENRKLNPYKDYLIFSFHFFDKSTLRYSKSGVNWLAKANDFQLGYAEKQPVLSYDELELVCFRKQDSIRILETSGTYYPTTLTWKGKGGKVQWERYNLGDSIHVVLADYSVETKKSIYEVTSAKLYYPELFPNGAVEGSFTDKILANSNRKGGSYPRFESRDSILNINNIGGGVRYVGGFRLHGTTVYGYGSKKNKARISVFDSQNQPQFRGNAELFVIRKGERIAGERVETTLYFDQDSLYHPSVNIKFEIPERELKLNRGNRGSDRNPFYNSLHMVNIDSDNIDWYLEKDSLVFGQQGVGFAKKEKTAVFESLKYYAEGDYRRLQNISSTNPLATLKSYADQEGDILSANNLAQRLNPRFDVTSIQSLLYDLVSKGFVNYDSDRQVVEVKDKVYHYANAAQGKVDYDVLRIVSESDTINATMSLRDNSVTVNGVRSLQFSRKQRVALRPYRRQLTLSQNRNMDFAGRIFAGYSLFEGKDFSYIYDRHHVEMDSVRYFDFFLPTGVVDKNGEPEALSISSRIEHATGVLLIDAPSNKSGIEDIPIFPSFQSKGPSYVYYDYDETQGGCYNRDSFYFELDKFSFNSLDRFTRDDLKFKGSMVTANIFPDFKETIVLQEDESFGFETFTPEEGYPTYSAKGNFNGSMELSNEGFFGKGNISYLGATVDSEDIIFRPRQMLATAERFDLAEDSAGPVEIPQAVGLDVNIDWKPYEDSMYVRTKEKPFDLFKAGEHTLKGTLILTPNGLKGRGLFDWSKGSMSSKLISFGVYSAQADTSSIRIKTIGEDALALNTDNVNADLDFTAQIGRVKANADDVETVMPFNQYQTSLNEFVWDMEKETVTFKNDKGQKGAFTSIHPDQDSLIFEGETAFYDLKTNELKIGGVEVIPTCDALVYVDSGRVDIGKNAKMATLENARIVANTENKYHVINRATVDIMGKKDYRAKGFYEYNIGDRKQEIEFANIIGTRVGKGKRSEKKTVTRANGEVKNDDNFYIDVKTEYRGEITLNAESKNLQFKGYARLEAENMPGREWFSVSFEGDKNDLAILYKVPKNYQGDPLRTGIYLSKTSAKMYPSVMMSLYTRKDRVIMDARGANEVGIFKYDRKKEQFNFGDSLRIVDETIRGNQLTFDNKSGEITAEGKLNVGSGLDYIDITAAGRIKTRFPESAIETDGFREPGETTMDCNIMAGIDMIIPDKLLKIMTTDIQSSSFDAQVVDYLKDSEYYERALSEFITNEKDYKSAVNKMKSSGLDLPGKYDPYEFFFSNLEMKWNAEYQSFVSAKNKVAVASVNGEVINRMLDCYIEFKMPTNEDDRVYIYIKSPSEFYYFFGYKQGVLSCVSNNEKFNEAVLSLKKKEASIKMDDGEFYEIAPVNPGSAQMFVNRVREARK